MDVKLAEESLSGSGSRAGSASARSGSTRCAAPASSSACAGPAATTSSIPAWQFGPDGKPLPVIARLVRAARGAGLSDERLYEVLATRTGISGEPASPMRCAQGKDEYVLSVVRGI